MQVLPFERWHLIGAVAHPKQERYQSLLDPESYHIASDSRSFLCENGLVCVGGLVDYCDGRAVWALFTDKITPGRFVAVYREMRRRLHALLEAGETVLVHIDPDYPEAIRMAEKLGFREAGIDRLEERSMIRMIAHV